MATPPYPVHPEPMKKSWLDRNPLWKIPLGCLTLFVLLAVLGIFLLTVITSSFRHSDVYKQAIVQATANPQVREQIGEPVQPDWLVSGELNVSGGSGKANLVIPISGPRGRGSIHAVAQKSGGVWRFTYLQVDFANQSPSIDLLSAEPSENTHF
jgi:Cytochrome oxidase complex assembly protein 1